jgi:hypothetical protein
LSGTWRWQAATVGGGNLVYGIAVRTA